jgi:OOP family OmpA-OmpF porin
MSDYFGHKILSGFTAGLLLAATVTTNSTESYYLLDCKGNPIKTAVLGKCVKTQTPNNPSKLFEICGEIVDTDRDGIPDKDDKCPKNTPEEIAKGVYQSGPKKGCPKDSDKDGVPDYKDECPNTPLGAKVDEKGCQIKVKKKSVNVVKMRTDVITLSGDVTFAFAKFKLTVQAQTMLATLVKQLKLNLIKTLEIVGHTDSVGRKSSNKKLSERRAKAVANYLIQLGIPPEKVSFRGDGESKPIANNRTKIGRAKNRRVEISILRFPK